VRDLHAGANVPLEAACAHWPRTSVKRAPTSGNRAGTHEDDGRAIVLPRRRRDVRGRRTDPVERRNVLRRSMGRLASRTIEARDARSDGIDASSFAVA
jgi:hypothetical protein